MNRKEYYKQWREKNKEYVKQKEKERNETKERKEYIKEYSKNNRELLNDLQRKWRKNNPEKSKEFDKNSKLKYKEKRTESNRVYVKNKRKTNPIFRMSENIRRQILLSIQRGGYTKRSSTYDILGCTYDEFKNHLEGLFEPWMNWSNYGLYNGELNYGWDIDHIIPRCSGKSEEDLIRLNHYTNLQPLCSKVNRDIKRNKITP